MLKEENVSERIFLSTGKASRKASQWIQKKYLSNLRSVFDFEDSIHWCDFWPFPWLNQRPTFFILTQLQIIEIDVNKTHFVRPWQIKFLAMYVYVLVFYIICSLTSYDIKIFVHVNKQKSISLAFLVNTNHFGS